MISKIGAHHHERNDELVMGHAERSDESDACGREVGRRKVGHTTRLDPVNGNWVIAYLPGVRPARVR